MSSPILSILMNQIMGDQDTQRRVNDENRARLSATAEEFAKNRDLDALSSILPQLSESGVDPRPFAQIAGRPVTAEEQFTNQLNSLMMNALTGAMNGGQGARQGGNQGARSNVQPSRSPSSTTTPAALNETANSLTSQRTQSQPAADFDITQIPLELEGPLRGAYKNLTGQDPGEHWLRDATFRRLYEARRQTLPDEDPKQTIKSIGDIVGYYPPDIVNAPFFTLDEKKQLTQDYINQRMRSPEALQAAQTIVDQAASQGQTLDLQQVLRVRTLAEAIDNRYPLNDSNQKIWDYYNGLEKIELDREYNKAYQTSIARTLAEKDATRIDAAKRQTPIPGSVLAEHGIDPAIYPTFESVTAAGKQFANQKDAETYNSQRGILQQFTEMQPLLFGPDGVFSGVGNSYIDRKKAAADLALGGRLAGTARGRNYQELSKRMTVLARTLAKETENNRLSDQDAAAYRQALFFEGGLKDVMDSESVARSVFFGALGRASQELDRLLTTRVGLEPTQRTNAVLEDVRATSRSAEEGKTQRSLVEGREYNYDDGSVQRFRGYDKDENELWEIVKEPTNAGK